MTEDVPREQSYEANLRLSDREVDAMVMALCDGKENTPLTTGWAVTVKPE